MMKRPTWATVVGVIGILFGIFGILGGGQEIMMPKMMEIQKQMLAEVSAAQNSQETNSSHAGGFPSEMLTVVEEMWDVPEWFGPWSVFSGISKALISALLLLSAIWLLQVKPVAIRLFYWAAGLSIVLCLFKLLIAFIGTDSLLVIGMSFGSAFRGLVDLVLIIVVATADKSAFIRAGKESLATRTG